MALERVKEVNRLSCSSPAPVHEDRRKPGQLHPNKQEEVDKKQPVPGKAQCETNERDTEGYDLVEIIFMLRLTLI